MSLAFFMAELTVVAGLKLGKNRRVVKPAVGVEAVGDGLAPLDLYFTGKTLRAPLRIANLSCQRRSLTMRVRGLLEWPLLHHTHDAPFRCQCHDNPTKQST